MRSRFLVLIPLLVMCFILVVACATEDANEAEAASATTAAAQEAGESSAHELSTWSPPTAAEVEDATRGLAFDEFLDTAYRLLLMRFPQTLSDIGLAEMFGVRNDRLNDYSEAYELETQRIERSILEQLRTYDRATLSPEQQLTYDVCEWSFDDLVEGHAYALYSYPVSHYFLKSLDQQLLDAMTEVHPFRSGDDVVDYLARLGQVDDQIVQIIAAIERRAAEGIVVPAVMIDWALGDLKALANSSVRQHPLYATLEEKSQNAGLPPDERDRLLERAREIMADEVLPVYQALHVTMQGLRVDAPSGIGFGQYEGGDAYYAYALGHQNQTNLTPQEIHELGLREVARLREELQAAAVELGMPDGLSLAEIYRRAGAEGGSVTGEAIVAEYERLLEDAKARAGAVFERLPRADVIVVPDDIGGYYRPAPADGSRLAQFAASNQGSKPKYRMATLTYHETIPGHHLQIGLSQELDLPLFRLVEVFLGYTEGWALYSEELAWELGWYDDNAYGNIGRLSDQMMRAVRLVVDTGIHVLGWSFERATEYFAEHTGRPYGESQYNILRYAAWPGQSTAYMVGRLEILRLRAVAQEALGEAFDLTSFHTAVLENGSVPLEILGQLIDAYIERERAEQDPA